MRFFPATLDHATADRLMDRHRRLIDETGRGFWALERRSDGAFLGFVGLNLVGDNGPMHNRWETGWRLARAAWGHGYATEAATAALAHARAAGLGPVVAFTARQNSLSEAVMRRLGMERRPGLDFDHPMLPPGHPLRPHIVYETPPCR
jgi:RimJ/RimL family protein N-acetyltransferase